MWNYILPPLLLLTSVFMILLVLIQRGRGGGLAGAFGGLGGQSAFGTKAGDLFTRVTIGVAAFWIILCAASVSLLNDNGSGLLNSNMGGATPPAQAPLGGGPQGTPPQGAAPTGAPGAAAPAADSKAAEGAAPAAATPPAATPPAATPPAESAPPAAAPPAEKPAEPGNK